jgi:hypothetical protein
VATNLYLTFKSFLLALWTGELFQFSDQSFLASSTSPKLALRFCISAPCSIYSGIYIIPYTSNTTLVGAACPSQTLQTLGAEVDMRARARAAIEARLN